jgi:hypothetical protein
MAWDRIRIYKQMVKNPPILVLYVPALPLNANSSVCPKESTYSNKDSLCFCLSFEDIKTLKIMIYNKNII